MTNIGWDRINRPTATGEWGQPHFWGAGEDDGGGGLMGWSGYAIDSEPALVQIMAWYQSGDKPLPEPMQTQFTEAYMQH